MALRKSDLTGLTNGDKGEITRLIETESDAQEWSVAEPKLVKAKLMRETSGVLGSGLGRKREHFDK